MVLAFLLFCLFSINIAKRLGRNTTANKSVKPSQLFAKKVNRFFPCHTWILDIFLFFKLYLRLKCFSTKASFFRDRVLFAPIPSETKPKKPTEREVTQGTTSLFRHIQEVTSNVSRSCDFAQKWRFLLLLCAMIFAYCAKRENQKSGAF